jgi:hypothetical protein
MVQQRHGLAGWELAPSIIKYQINSTQGPPPTSVRCHTTVIEISNKDHSPSIPSNTFLLRSTLGIYIPYEYNPISPNSDYLFVVR